MELSYIFIKILNMSFTASYCIISVIVLRFLLRKQAKIFSYLLWSVVLFRLICPFSISSTYSLLRVDTDIISQENIDRWAAADLNQNNMEDDDIPTLPTQINTDNIQDSFFNFNTDMQEMSRNTWINEAFVVASWIWAAGMALLILYSIVATLRMRYSLKNAIYIEKNIYEAEGIDTPFVFGIVRPRIYIPAYINEDERKYVLTHEEIHIVRRDYLIKILAYLVVCLHWFNPLVWVAFVLMENDMEMSCDEAVLKKLGEGVKKEYSRSLLSLSVERKLFQGSPLAFGEGNVKGRIQNILGYHKRAFITVVLAVAILIIVSVGLILNPAGDNVDEVDLDRLSEFVENYATAFSGRDGAKMVEAYIDEETALENVFLLEKVGDDVYTLGMSSPFVDSFRYRIIQEENKADIYYYAMTFDPHMAVWKEEMHYTTVEGEIKAVGSSLKFLDSISSKEEFDEAYMIDGEYQFVNYLENGFVEEINYQIETGNVYTNNTVYAKPETAAANILNLTGGSGRVEGDYSWQAMVRYTFADGSEVMIPMYNPVDEEAGSGESWNGQDIWIVDTAVWNAKAP
ncbi:MAG: M56 family metallopeptidase [Lachnospiraceae bacterium]|nr:M56 family metallopeptidase [Lachnospiraceae bacterium]